MNETAPVNVNPHAGTGRFLADIVSSLAETFKADRCTLFLYDEKDGTLTMRAAHGFPMFGRAMVVLKLGEGVVGRVLAERRPIYSEMASTMRGYVSHANFPDDDVQTFLGIPLLRGRERVGVLVLHRRTGTPFLADEISAIRARAVELSASIQSAQALMLANAREVAGGEETEGKLKVESQMVFRGESVSNGWAMGRCMVHKRVGLTIGDGADAVYPPARRDLDEAIAIVEAHIRELTEELDRSLPEAASMIFEASAMILHDESFTGRIRQSVAQGGKSLPEAIAAVTSDYVKVFENAENDYLREKARDVEDLGLRLLEAATSEDVSDSSDKREGSIIISSRIMPSDVLRIARDRLGGIVLCGGGATAHVTLLVRSLRIPTIIVHDRNPLRLPDGENIILDCANQTVYVHPDEAVAGHFAARARAESRERPRIVSNGDAETRTADGVRITLNANVNILAELETARGAGAEGVGLYRTEFPFLMRQSLPTEAEQVSIYERVLDAMPDSPVVFRTLDAGGDKIVSSLCKAKEDNPALGLRSIRLTLKNSYIFEQQLRALMHAIQNRARDDVSIMFPMISSLEEFRAARQHVETCLAALRVEIGDKTIHEPFIGTMIEVPAVVGIIDAIAEESDFFSIGTNDLIQYTLAVDRTNSAVAGNYLPQHPTVLRTLATVADAAHRHNIPCSVCGEMGRDPRFIPFLVGIGLRSFSLEPVQIVAARELISRISVTRCESYAAELLKFNTIAEIDAMIDDFSRETFD